MAWSMSSSMSWFFCMELRATPIETCRRCARLQGQAAFYTGFSWAGEKSLERRQLKPLKPQQKPRSPPKIGAGKSLKNLVLAKWEGSKDPPKEKKEKSEITLRIWHNVLSKMETSLKSLCWEFYMLQISHWTPRGRIFCQMALLLSGVCCLAFIH